MNNTLDNPNNINLEQDFNAAINMCSQSHEYEQLMALLNSDKIVEKQLATLELNEVRSKDDAMTLVSNLVGQDGKIREAVAFKINDLVQNPLYSEFFIDEKVFDIFLQGLMDINGNVCRQIGSKWNGECGRKFELYLCKKLPESIRKILIEIEKIDQQSRQYVISKRNFQLYWCLEALYNIVENINLNEVQDILFKTGTFYDYTIREKTARILAKIDNSEFKEMKTKLKNDENYYVRRYLADWL